MKTQAYAIYQLKFICYSTYVVFTFLLLLFSFALGMCNFAQNSSYAMLDRPLGRLSPGNKLN